MLKFFVKQLKILLKIKKEKNKMYKEISQEQLKNMIKKLPKTIKIKHKKEYSKEIHFDSYWLDDKELFYLDIGRYQTSIYITNYFEMIV